MYRNRNLSDNSGILNTTDRNIPIVDENIDNFAFCQNQDHERDEYSSETTKRICLNPNIQGLQNLSLNQQHVKAFALKDTKKYSLEDIKQGIESDFAELQDQGYVFQDESKIIAKTRNFNRIFDTDSQDFLFYKDLVEQYNKADKLVDEYGRVFFYIPGLSDDLICSESRKGKYGYLLPMYREWLSQLNSYEVKVANGQHSFVRNLGKRAFIYGDQAYIDKRDHEFTEESKDLVAEGNFHVIVDQNDRVYYSNIPQGICKTLEPQRIIENLRNTSNYTLNFAKSLLCNRYESILLNTASHIINEHDHGYQYIINNFDPKFLYSKTAGLSLPLHRHAKDQHISFNIPHNDIREVLFVLDQRRFHDVADEINLLSEPDILNKHFCSYNTNINNTGSSKINTNRPQFYYSDMLLRNRQLQNRAKNSTKFWQLSLSDVLYLQTNVMKDILFSDQERKKEYVSKITQEREVLSQIIDYYFKSITNFLTDEEIENYNYFKYNIPENDQEQQQAEEIFNKIENVLQNHKLVDLTNLQYICNEAVRRDVVIFTELAQDRKALTVERIHELPNQRITNDATVFIEIYNQDKNDYIAVNSEKINLLELMSYSVLRYLINILSFEFDSSTKKITKELQQEKEFLEKEIDGLHTEVEKRFMVSGENLVKSTCQHSMFNDKYGSISNDIIKLNKYLNHFCNPDIQKIRKYEYINNRLTSIKKAYEQDKSALNKLLSARIDKIIAKYVEYITKLESKISKMQLKHETQYIPSKNQNQEETISDQILFSRTLKELDQICPIEEEINNQSVFKISDEYRRKSYRYHLRFGVEKNTLLIYNNESALDQQEESLDDNLMQPGYSYCYNRSLENFNSRDLIEKVHTTIIQNHNIHIVGVNDGTADAQYILSFITSILHQSHDSGKNYNGEIFVELYNPVGISKKISRKMNDSIRNLKLKNKIVVNIINEALNKSINVGQCLGIDFAVDEISDKSSCFIRHDFLNSLDDYLGYKYPHYCKASKKESYYLKLKPGALKEYRKNVWGIEDDTIPTVHCMKRLVDTKKHSVFDTNTYKEIYDEVLYDEALYRELLKSNIDVHDTFDNIKDYLSYSPLGQRKIETINNIISAYRMNHRVNFDQTDFQMETLQTY